jgi:hypothetical protein
MKHFVVNSSSGAKVHGHRAAELVAVPVIAGAGHFSSARTVTQALNQTRSKHKSWRIARARLPRRP